LLYLFCKYANTKTLSESELLKRVAAGDRNAYAILYNQYLSGLYQYTFLFTKSKQASEDIVQNVFVRIWERRTLLVAIDSFKPYLYRSAKNLLLDEIRKNQAKARATEILKPQSEELAESSDDKLVYDQYYKVAEEAISRLSEKRRQIFLLRTREELSLDEIAANLSISKSVVKKQLYAGITFVRHYIQQHGITTVILIDALLQLLAEKNNLHTGGVLYSSLFV
jgi:RNA polymerase sigma-70 factor (ECF subfamily)